MRTLLIANGTSHHVGTFFRGALESLGHPHVFLDESRYAHRGLAPLPIRALSRLSGYRAWRRWRLNQRAVSLAEAFRPDALVVVGGAFMMPAALRRIRERTGAVLVNLATDDPFNPRHRTRAFIEGIPCYDVYATVRRSILADLAGAGARRPVYVRCGYEPALHFPEPPATADERSRFGCDACFAGAADQDRYPLFRRLVGAPDIAVRLYGGFWERDPVLHPFARGFAYGRDYRQALGGAHVALCLVRKANRDGHVMRTYEIPACGAFALADRTDEHLEILEEDREAVYFTGEDELVDKLRFYLAHPDLRGRIAAAGRARITGGANTWRDRLVELLNLAAAARSSR